MAPAMVISMFLTLPVPGSRVSDIMMAGRMRM